MVQNERRVLLNPSTTTETEKWGKILVIAEEKMSLSRDVASR